MIPPSISRPDKAYETLKDKNPASSGEMMPLEIRQKPKSSKSVAIEKSAYGSFTSTPSVRAAGDKNIDSNPASGRGSSEAEQYNTVTSGTRPSKGGSPGEPNRERETHSKAMNEDSKISRDSTARDTEPASINRAGYSLETHERMSAGEASAASVTREPEPSKVAAPNPQAPVRPAVATTPTPSSASAAPKKTVLKKVANPSFIKQKLKRSSTNASGESPKLPGFPLSSTSSDKHHKKAATASASAGFRIHPSFAALINSREELSESGSVSESIDSVLGAPTKITPTEPPTLADVVSSRTEETTMQIETMGPPRRPDRDIEVRDDSMPQPMVADVAG